MREKAVLAAQAVYGRLVDEAAAGGCKLTHPWAKVRQALADNPGTAHLVAHLPRRLDRAVQRQRKDRLIQGRPPGYLAAAGAGKPPLGGFGSNFDPDQGGV